jgi:hypothetical protein
VDAAHLKKFQLERRNSELNPEELNYVLTHNKEEVSEAEARPPSPKQSVGVRVVPVPLFAIETSRNISIKEGSKRSNLKRKVFINVLQHSRVAEVLSQQGGAMGEGGGDLFPFFISDHVEIQHKAPEEYAATSSSPALSVFRMFSSADFIDWNFFVGSSSFHTNSDDHLCTSTGEVVDFFGDEVFHVLVPPCTFLMNISNDKNCQRSIQVDYIHISFLPFL